MKPTHARLVIALGLLSALTPTALAAQRRFEEFIAAPLSPIAVFHGSVVEDSAGATLDVAVVVRGPAGWLNARVGYDLGRADSLPAGVYAQGWQIGARTYRLRLDEGSRTLELFGQRLALTESNLVLVTLGARPEDAVEVRLGARVAVRVREGVPVSQDLLAASAEVRAFIGENRNAAP